MSFTIESRILSRVHYLKYSTIDYTFVQPNETKSYIRWQGEALNAIFTRRHSIVKFWPSP